MNVVVEAINGLYIIVNNGERRLMNDSSFDQIMNVEAGDILDLSSDELNEYWEI